jgi:hypothetical protein
MDLRMEDAAPHISYASHALGTRGQLETVGELDLPAIGFRHFISVDDATWAAIRAWLKNK